MGINKHDSAYLLHCSWKIGFVAKTFDFNNLLKSTALKYTLELALEELSSFKSNIVSFVWFILSPKLHCIRQLMKPNTMRSMVPLPGRQKAFVSATAPMLTHFRGQLGLLLNQWTSTAPFWIVKPHALCSHKWPIWWLREHKIQPIKRFLVDVSQREF